jgi:hypothetical protein
VDAGSREENASEENCSARCSARGIDSMKIRKHSESHLVELDDGSRWRIFPGDLDVTLNWQPDVELKVVRIPDEISSHSLVSGSDNSRVRVLPEGEDWPIEQMRDILGET